MEAKDLELEDKTSAGLIKLHLGVTISEDWLN
jgi:hypothetical protein